MTTLLLTAYDSAMAPIGDLTSPLMLAYANRHGFDFHCSRVFGNRIETESEPYWQKIWDIKMLMNRGNPCGKLYDRLMWLDADQMVTNPDWTPPWTSGFHASLDWGVDAVDDNHFSACGFVVCADSLNVIYATAAKHEEFEGVPFPEQAAMRRFREYGDYSIKKSLQENMHIHPRRVFNAVPTEICEDAPEPWQLGDFCCHLTHLDVHSRVEVFYKIHRRANL